MSYGCVIIIIIIIFFWASGLELVLLLAVRVGLVELHEEAVVRNGQHL